MRLRNEPLAFSPTILLLLIIGSCAAHKVTESTEDLPPESFNTTALFPVTPLGNQTKDAKQKTATSWKIETTFAQSLEKTDDNSTEKEERVEKPVTNASKEFKPSTHLGDFFDEDNLDVRPTRESFDAFSPVIKKPPTDFGSSSKPKQQKESLKNHHGFPYKFESAIHTRAREGWRPAESPHMDSKPTAAVPVKVPAGGLYQLPADTFRDKPGVDGDDEDFGLSFGNDVKDVKDISVKKRSNPWTKLMHIITALIPVGIIVSALTPNVITLESTDNLQGSQQILRRVGAGAPPPLAQPPPPPASERCRRRLLCELHSEDNYVTTGERRHQPCHRIRCEDPEGLERSLRWLLAHHRAQYGDHRARIT